MKCEEFRNKYKASGPCCPSCHEDDITGHGDDLWFTIDGVDWNICCAAFLAYELRLIKETNKTGEQ